MDEQHIKGDVYMQIRKEGEETFYNIKLKKVISAICCVEGKNMKLDGMPRIVYRKHNKTYGNEIYFQFWIMNKREEYEANSIYDNFEYYLSEDEGLEFLRIALNKIEELKNE